MSNIVIVRNNGNDTVTVVKKAYDGTLEQLHKDTNSETVMLYRAQIYCNWCDIPDVLIVCDDDGKLKGRPATMPIYNEKGEIVDVFVGDVAFIAEDLQKTGEDRGLTPRETELLVAEIQMLYDRFVVPYIEDIVTE